MVEKRTKKKLAVKKKDEGYDPSEIESQDEIFSKDQIKTNDNVKSETREYKTYDIETDFKLKEVLSEENKVIIGPQRLTRFEKARITGARSLQLSLGAPTLFKIPKELTDTIMIAKYELEKKALPISIRRILPNGLYQDIPIDWTI